MRTLAIAALVGLGLAGPSSVRAQVAPDSPRLISPHGSGGLGVHWVRAEALPGDDGVLLGTWALPFLPDGMRVRGGAGKGAGGTNAILGGLDFQRPLMRRTPARRFDLDWQGGVGVSLGEWALVTVPVGLTGGVSWTSGAVWLAPYVTAGVAADLRLGDDAPAREFEVSPTMDVGVDLSFDTNRKLVLRAAAALGDRQALSLGVAFGLGRLAAR
jgi:hypothetical protein